MYKIDTFPMRVAVCNHLREIIDERSLDVDSLAVEIGVKPSSLRRVLDGRFDFNVSVLFALCNVLRVGLCLRML